VVPRALTQDDLTNFIRSSIRSVWAIELLVCLQKNKNRAWPLDDLVKELRSSRAAISEAAGGLIAASLIAETDGRLQYAPATPELDQLAHMLQRAYAERPASTVQTIVEAREDALRKFADAFKFKKDT
jgi:hypothetical protein